jgi:hypothetical protein
MNPLEMFQANGYQLAAALFDFSEVIFLWSLIISAFAGDFLCSGGASAVGRKTMKENRNSQILSRPLSGEEFVNSLQDGREVWIYGERV